MEFKGHHYRNFHIGEGHNATEVQLHAYHHRGNHSAEIKDYREKQMSMLKSETRNMGATMPIATARLIHSTGNAFLSVNSVGVRKIYNGLPVVGIT